MNACIAYAHSIAGNFRVKKFVVEQYLVSSWLVFLWLLLALQVKVDSLASSSSRDWDWSTAYPRVVLHTEIGKDQSQCRSNVI